MWDRVWFRDLFSGFVKVKLFMRGNENEMKIFCIGFHLKPCPNKAL